MRAEHARSMIGIAPEKGAANRNMESSHRCEEGMTSLGSAFYLSSNTPSPCRAYGFLSIEQCAPGMAIFGLGCAKWSTFPSLSC
jgi:hypothetical protein